MLTNIPVTIISGFLGVGKTTAILDLLRGHPKNERWAVLVNEFGEVGIDGAALAGEGYAVKEVPGGCICCTAQTQMRVALTRLLREAKPQRLIIEPTGLGHPAGVIDTLRDEWLVKVLSLRATICLVDPRQFCDAKLIQAPVYQDQLNLADVLVANKSDLASPAQLAAFDLFAEQMYPPKLHVAHTQFAKLDPAWLDWVPYGMRTPSHPQAHAHSHPHQVRPESSPHPLSDRSTRYEATGLDSASCGWIFSPDTIFSQTRLRALFHSLSQMNGLLRAKGILRTGKEWQLFNWAQGEVSVEPIAYRRDSRVELIAQLDTAPDWDAFESAVMKARL